MNRKSLIRVALFSVAISAFFAASSADAQIFRVNNQPLFPRLHAWFSSPGYYYYTGTPRALFNGEDLTGWTNVKGEAPGEGWKVEDGCIFREKNAGDLYTDGKFENFILEFEFKIAEKGNSGIKYRSWNTDGWGMGCEYQIYDDINDEKNPPKYQTGALYDVIVPREGAPKIKMGEFNKGKIVSIGNHIEHYLNDQLVMCVDVGTQSWNEAIAKSKFKDVKEFGTTAVGRILLQDHNCQVWFKNLYITELTLAKKAHCWR